MYNKTFTNMFFFYMHIKKQFEKNDEIQCQKMLFERKLDLCISVINNYH